MHVTRLPSIASVPPSQGQGEEPTPVQVFVELWMAALGDRANDMVCDPRLVVAAQIHVDYLDARTGSELEQSMHVGKNNSMPNQRVREQGYILPSFYPERSNQVECVLRYNDKAADALRLFLESPSHRPMMLREDWYKNHVVYGIGHAHNDWVILACPPTG